MRKKYFFLFSTIFIFSIAHAMEEEQKDVDLNSIEELSSNSKQLSLKDKAIVFSLSAALGASLAGAAITTSHYVGKTQAFQESYEYIKEIPNPVKLFLAVSGGCLISHNLWLHYQLQNQLQKQEESYDRINFLDILSRKANASSIINEHHHTALREAIKEKFREVNNRMLDAKLTSCLHIMKLSLVVEELKESVDTISKKQEKTLFLTDIVQELQDDIRYRDIWSRAATVENQRSHNNNFNLGGVE